LPAEGITTHWGKEIPKNKVTAHDMGERLRLGSEKHHSDYWFDYGKKSIIGDTPKKLVQEIIKL
jgi:hypothetical protein